MNGLGAKCLLPLSAGQKQREGESRNVPEISHPLLFNMKSNRMNPQNEIRFQAHITGGIAC